MAAVNRGSGESCKARMKTVMAAAWVLLQLVASATAVQAQPGIISPPPAVTAIPLSSSRIKLSWNAATNTSIITAYRMYRNNTLVTTVAGTARTYTDTGLAAAVTYAYQIQTATSGKYSVLSTMVIARTAVLVAASSPTLLPIQYPSKVSGFTGDASGPTFNWGFMQPGAHVEYDLDITQAGAYSLKLSAASWDPYGGVKVFLNKTVLAGTITFWTQGSWTHYITSDALAINMPTGLNTLRVQDATGIGFNLAGLTLKPGAPSIMPRKGVNAGDIMRAASKVAAVAQAARLADAGVAWVRADFPWSEMEYSGPGQYSADSIGAHDVGVQALAARGIKVLGIIDYTPPWANGGKDQMVPPKDAYIAYFGKFAAYLAKRYGPMGVHTWEVANEPNIVPFWSTGANPAQYTKLLKVAYLAIKAADPTATVISAGLAPTCTCDGNLTPQDFLRGMYAAGARGSFDAVGMHPYTYPALPTATDGSAYWWTAMQELRVIMTANGDATKAIWLTEYGAPTNGPSADSGRVSEARQASMLTQAYRLNRGTVWMGPIFWYCFNDPGTDNSTVENFFGMVRADGSAKPSFAALRAAPNA